MDQRPRRRMSVEERRRAILEAAGDAFAEAPYEQVSVAAVAARAHASEALVHRYFASKAELYLTVVRAAVEGLLERQREADTALGPDASPRQRLATSIEVYLDLVAAGPVGWAAPLRNPHDGIPQAAQLRARVRAHYVELLRALFGLEPAEPRDHALHGYLGFLDAACLAWAGAGCPPEHRQALVEMSVAALDAALRAVESLDRGAHGACLPVGDMS